MSSTIDSGYQFRILADRYARKDTVADVVKGDYVVSSIVRRFDRDGEKIESRELGKVVRVDRSTGVPLIDVALIDNEVDEENWEIVTGLERPKVEVLLETSYEDICQRIANAVVEKDTDSGKEIFRDSVYQAMIKREFVPAGRILAGLGCDDRTLTFFNCYVFPPPKDSRGGIADHWKALFNTFSIGGGVGWDNSSLRPRGAVVKKVNGRSSGAVSWMEQFSQITGAVEQGGSRRGAAMQALWCWHPDIIEFVQAKADREEFELNGRMVSRNKNLLENANVSVLISDTFMEAVKKNLEWHLVFPDTADQDYDKFWDGDLEKWKEEKRPIVVHNTLPARDLWNMIIDRAWESGEPGLIFMERANKLSNSYYFNKISCTNPCGEQLLPPHAVCNLGHLNLAKFIREDAKQLPPEEITAQQAYDAFDIRRFEEAVHMGVRFLDNIIDLNHYHDERMQKQEESERRIGLGILGYGEMLVRLGLRYGSDEALIFTEFLFEQFAKYSYEASAKLAMERGSFPAFDKEKFLGSGFVSSLVDRNPELEKAITLRGMRNVTLNTVAPTGSVGTMLGTTTGIEPYFQAAWVARSRIGSANEEANVLRDLRRKYGDKLPSYFVTSSDITPREHVETQAAVQKYIDASISKTVNLPNSAAREEVAAAYQLMYDLGCKGGTVYRSGSRDKQVLYSIDEDGTKVPVEIVDEYKDPAVGVLRPKIECGIVPAFFSVETPVSGLNGGIRLHPKTGAPYDFFMVSGKGDVAADVQAISRLISVILRWPDGEEISQETRLEIIRDQLYRIPGRGQIGFGPSKVVSLPDGVAHIIHRYLAGDFPMANLPFGEDQITEFLENVGEVANPEKVKAWVANKDEGVVDEQTEDEIDDDFDFDICGSCGEATFVDIPGKCGYCTNPRCAESSC